MNSHLENLIHRIPTFKSCAADIEQAFVLLRNCFQNGGKVLICGNGGSAADAEHWAGELLKGFRKKGNLSPDLSEKLPPHIAPHLQGALPVIPLTGFPSFATAFANDVNSEMIFAQLVIALGKKGDTVIGITTSGDSKNILHAVETAKCLGMNTLGLTGKTGGKLAAMTDVCIRVPEITVYLVQEYHRPVYHCLSAMLEDAFFEE